MHPLREEGHFLLIFPQTDTRRQESPSCPFPPYNREVSLQFIPNAPLDDKNKKSTTCNMAVHVEKANNHKAGYPIFSLARRSFMYVPVAEELVGWDKLM